jgi:hypothetical protein
MAGAPCSTHDAGHALCGGPAPPAPPGPAKAPAAVLPKKWTIKWPEGTGGAGAIMSCEGCNQVPQLYDDLRAACPPVDDAALAKLAKYCEQSLLYMGHMLRCCVQQAHINALMATLHDNPTHAHVVVDYKVSMFGGVHVYWLVHGG